MDGTLSDEDKYLLGYEATPRFLPYKIQDIYSRSKDFITLKAVILENEYLKAVFLPEYGGRLYSLYSKELERDLLFTNSVIQPGNLAILNAWISGGIEWNVGQFGHSFTTCSPLYCAILKDKNGEDFLRMYEYERCHKVFWHLDFHLPKGSKTLNMYARIINDEDLPTSMYYWTNIAVHEEKKSRIFSDADEVLYLNMENKKFGKCNMPYIPYMEDIDASYPALFSNSSEYFFQNKKDTSPWEAIIYPDDWAFFERSSSVLCYRKMFCWGTHKGGQRWKDYLSEDNRGNYVEIQGGFAPTQLHGMIMEPNSELEFVQCFGGASLDTNDFYMDWDISKNKFRQFIDKAVPTDYIDDQLNELSQYKDIESSNIICFGSGFAALEARKRVIEKNKLIPKGLCFPESSLTKEQESWIHLLDFGFLPEGSPNSLNETFLVDKYWEEKLMLSLNNINGKTWITYLHLSIIHMENGEYHLAREMANKSIELEPNPLAYRNIALLFREDNNKNKAIENYEKAIALLNEKDGGFVIIEYFDYLLSMEEYSNIWDKYYSLSYSQRENEKLYLNAVYSALKLNKLDFVKEAFSKEYVYIREDETKLSDIWIEYHQKIEKIKGNCTHITREEIEKKYPIPRNIDFRMIIK